MSAQQIMVVFTINTDKLPENFGEILKHEQEVVDAWKQEGKLAHLFLRETRNGAILVFNGSDESEVKTLMESLPLYPFVKSTEYYALMKQF